ncbi:MAG: hypothetical protein JW913_17605 [Chitinispirillaceae bacterium]|nr:hypothetical protein [Chitinispirillaceae bacterium]
MQCDRKFHNRCVAVDNSGHPIYDPLPYMHNGGFQQIVWLGVAGYLVINHVDRDIILIDPWPSYHSWWIGSIMTRRPRPLYKADQATLHRIAALVNFIRNARSNGYSFSAILLSHMHFDHVDDVPVVLELLTKEERSYRSDELFGRRVRESDIVLRGPAFPIDELPTVVADFDTMVYLKTQYFGVPTGRLIGPAEGGNFSRQGIWKRRRGYWYGKGQLKQIGKRWVVTDMVNKRYGCGEGGSGRAPWYEIRQNNNRLFYDDSFNSKVFDIVSPALHRAVPATRADPVELDHCSFTIVPYVWDHMNRPALFGARCLDLNKQMSGSMQRTTAFMISRKRAWGGNEIASAKTAFFVGSSGEMTHGHTRPAPERMTITTDLLVQTAMGDCVPADGWFDAFTSAIATWKLPKLMKACREYFYQHIAINDYLVWGHWDEYIRWIAAHKSNKKKKTIHYGFELAYGDNIDTYREIITRFRADGVSYPPENGSIMEQGKLISLERAVGSTTTERAGDGKKSRAGKSVEFEIELPLSVADLHRKYIEGMIDSG